MIYLEINSHLIYIKTDGINRIPSHLENFTLLYKRLLYFAHVE